MVVYGLSVVNVQKHAVVNQHGRLSSGFILLLLLGFLLFSK